MGDDICRMTDGDRANVRESQDKNRELMETQLARRPRLEMLR